MNAIIEYPDFGAIRFESDRDSWIGAWDSTTMFEAQGGFTFRGLKVSPWIKQSENCEILVKSPLGSPPSVAQDAAIQWFLRSLDSKKAQEIFEALLPAFQDELDFQTKHAEAKGMSGEFIQELDSMQMIGKHGLYKSAFLTAISFLEFELQGEAFIEFVFNCNWDEEHSAAILVHRGRVLAVDRGDEFSYWTEDQFIAVNDTN
jgi:hypothetical protein